MGKLLGHLWYPSEELFGLALLDRDIPIEHKQEMVSAMKSVDSNEDRMRRPKILKSSTATAKLCDFFTQSSITFFEKLGLETQFIDVDLQEWEDKEDFQDGVKVAGDLAVVNDHAERGVVILQEYS